VHQQDSDSHRPGSSSPRREWRFTPIGRRAIAAWRRACAPAELIRRRAAAQSALEGAPGLQPVDPVRGYARIEPGELADVDSLLAGCEHLMERARTRDAEATKRGGKLRLVAELLDDAELARDPRYVGFALQPALLVRVTQYLRTVPWLARVSLAVSFHVPEAREPGYFQRFHVDNDDTRQVKLYLNARAIERDEGPLQFLPADTSARVLRALAREGRRVGRATTFSDEEVFRHCDPSEVVRVEGPRGAGALIDLSRCLHFGSRVEPGRERAVFGVTYLRYHRLHENTSNQLDPALAHGDGLRALALRGPRSYPRGHFYPESGGADGGR
jgi:hypothetical protein